MDTTPKMGLKAWDLQTDFYDHSELALNWSQIDAHDHTTGKGTQIPTGGLKDSSVTSAKIADGSVTLIKLAADSVNASKIIDGSVGNVELASNSVSTAKVQDEAITRAKLAPGVAPLGEVIHWYRINSGVPIPTGWAVCDGTPWANIPNALGATTGSIPNLVNKFILGAGLSGVGSGPGTPPDINQTGGAHTRDLTHSHTVAAHVHGVFSHAHPIGPGGEHNHGFITQEWDSNDNPIPGAVVRQARQRGSAVPGSAGDRQAFYIPGLNRNEYYGEDVEAPMSQAGSHDHGGGTGGSAYFNSDVSAPGTSTALSTTDTRPAFVGLLPLMRVL